MKRVAQCLAAIVFLMGVSVSQSAYGTPSTELAATASPQVSSITITDSDLAGGSSELHLRFAKPISAKRAATLLARLSGTASHIRTSGGGMKAVSHGRLTVRDVAAPSTDNGTSRTPKDQQDGVSPDGPGPQGQLLDCDRYYGFSDHDGTFHIQRACTSSSAPWGYQISPAVQAIIVGSVSEAGLEWARNGVTQPKMAQHPSVVKNYIFHGTFSGSPANTHIAYTDYINFRYSNGSGYIQFYGSFVLTGNRPCNPGGPC